MSPLPSTLAVPAEMAAKMYYLPLNSTMMLCFWGNPPPNSPPAPRNIKSCSDFKPYLPSHTQDSDSSCEHCVLTSSGKAEHLPRPGHHLETLILLVDLVCLVGHLYILQVENIV